MIQCVVMCSTAQLVSITLNSAANEPRFTILKERVNVLGMGPLLALASAALLSHTASLFIRHSYSEQQHSSHLISACGLRPLSLTRSSRRIEQHQGGRSVQGLESAQVACCFISASTFVTLVRMWLITDAFPDWICISPCLSR